MRKRKPPMPRSQIYVLAAYLVIFGLLALGVFSAKDKQEWYDRPMPAPTVVPATKPAAALSPGPAIRHLGEPVTYPDAEPANMRLPYLVIVEPDVGKGWQVEKAAKRWNELTGCRIFTLDPTERHNSKYIVSEQRNLSYVKPDGTPSGPLWGWQWGPDVRLNPDFGRSIEVSFHELGHIAGLEHNDADSGVMNPAGVDNDLEPSPEEVELVRQIQPLRCGVDR